MHTANRIGITVMVGVAMTALAAWFLQAPAEPARARYDKIICLSGAQPFINLYVDAAWSMNEHGRLVAEEALDGLRLDLPSNLCMVIRDVPTPTAVPPTPAPVSPAP
jgi:hypothetical protein